MTPTMLDDVSLIATHVRNCLDGFHGVCSEFINADRAVRNKVPPGTFHDAFGRFRLWVGNIGAHRKGRASLDYKLREASHIRDRVIELLQNLETVLREALEIVTGKRVPWEDLSDSDSDISETDLAPQDGEESTELAQLASNMTEINSCLMRLSLAIRNPAPHDQFKESKQIDVTHFEAFDIEHVRGKFPSAPEYLILRLGKAISRRRQYLRYREEHRKKLEQGLPIQPLPQETECMPEVVRTITAPSEKIESTVASSIPLAIKASTTSSNLDDIDYYEDTLSQTSYASSSNDSSKLRPPPLPDAGQDGDPFECPLCFRFTSVRQTPAWHKHVYRDLQPYVCTFDGCELPDRTYESRHEWFQHEVHAHRKWWECIEGCNLTFHALDAFHGHLTSEHPGLASNSRISDLVRNCERQKSMDVAASCSLCQIELPSLTQLRRHMGKHHEELSLFALPSHMKEDDNEVDEDDIDDGSRSSIAGSDRSRSTALIHCEQCGLSFEGATPGEDLARHQVEIHGISITETPTSANPLFEIAKKLLEERPSVVQAMDDHVVDLTLIEPAARAQKPDDVVTWAQYKQWLTGPAKPVAPLVSQDLEHVHLLQATMFHTMLVTQETDGYCERLVGFHKHRDHESAHQLYFTVDRTSLSIYQIVKAMISQGGIRALGKTQKWADLGYHLGWGKALTLDGIRDVKDIYSDYILPFEHDVTERQPLVNLSVSFQATAKLVDLDLQDIPRATTIRNLRGLILTARPKIEAPELMSLSLDGRPLWHSDTLDTILPHGTEASIHVDFPESPPIEVPLPGLVELATEISEIAIPVPGRLVVAHDRWIYLPQSNNQCFHVHLHSVRNLAIITPKRIEIEGPLNELVSGSWIPLQSDKVFLDFHEKGDFVAACEHIKSRMPKKLGNVQVVSNEVTTNSSVSPTPAIAESYDIRVIVGTLISKKVPATIQVIDGMLVIEVTAQLTWKLEGVGPGTEPHRVDQAHLFAHNQHFEIRGMKNVDTGEFEDVLFKAQTPRQTPRIWAVIQRFLMGEKPTPTLGDSATSEVLETVEADVEDVHQSPTPAISIPDSENTHPGEHAPEHEGAIRLDQQQIAASPSTHTPSVISPEISVREITDCLGLTLSASTSTANRGVPQFDNPDYRKLASEITKLSKELPKGIDALLAFTASLRSLDSKLDELLETYGPYIWGKNADRSCLRIPNWIKRKYGVRDLFYEDPEHRDIIKIHLRAWIIREACYNVQMSKLKPPFEEIAEIQAMLSKILKACWDRSAVAHGEHHMDSSNVTNMVDPSDAPEDTSESDLEDLPELSLPPSDANSIMRFDNVKVTGLPKGQNTKPGTEIAAVQLQEKRMYIKSFARDFYNTSMSYRRMKEVEIEGQVVRIIGQVAMRRSGLKNEESPMISGIYEISLQLQEKTTAVALYQQILSKKAVHNFQARNEDIGDSAHNELKEESMLNAQDEPDPPPSSPHDNDTEMHANLERSVPGVDPNAITGMPIRGYIRRGGLVGFNRSRVIRASLDISADHVKFTPYSDPEFPVPPKLYFWKWQSLNWIERGDVGLALVTTGNTMIVTNENGVDLDRIVELFQHFRPGMACRTISNEEMAAQDQVDDVPDDQEPSRDASDAIDLRKRRDVEQASKSQAVEDNDESERGSGASNSELSVKHQVFDGFPPLLAAVDAAADPTLPGGYFDMLYEDMAEFKFGPQQPRNEVVENEFAAYMAKEYSWIPSASQQIARAYSVFRKWGLLCAVRRRAQLQKDEVQQSSAVGSASTRASVLPGETRLPVRHQHGSITPTRDDMSRESSEESFFVDVAEEQHAFLTKIMEDTRHDEVAAAPASDASSSLLDGEGIISAKEHEHKLPGPDDRLNNRSPAKDVDEGDEIAPTSPEGSPSRSRPSLVVSVNKMDIENELAISQSKSRLDSSSHQFSSPTLSEAERDLDRHLDLVQENANFTATFDNGPGRIDITQPTTSSEMHPAYDLSDYSQTKIHAEASDIHRRFPHISEASLADQTAIHDHVQPDQYEDAESDTSVFIMKRSDMIDRMKDLNVDSESSDDEEQLRRYRTKKKRWRAGMIKRSHSQGVEGDSSYSENESFDIKDSQARRLRRRVRGPRDKQLSLIFQDPDDQGRSSAEPLPGSTTTNVGAAQERESSMDDREYTCPDWANGHCSKSDESCQFKHYDTGIIASRSGHKSDYDHANDSGNHGSQERGPEQAVTKLETLQHNSRADELESQITLAQTHISNGHSKEAIALLEHVIETQRAILGEHHPDRLASQSNLALTYRSNGQFKEAIALLEHVVETQRAILGEYHPDRLASQLNIATKYYPIGQMQQAIALLEHAVENGHQVQVPHHDSQLNYQRNLAIMYKANGQTKEAVELLERVLEHQANIPGPPHADQLALQQELVSAYQSVGQTEKAAALLEHVANIKRSRPPLEEPQIDQWETLQAPGMIRTKDAPVDKISSIRSEPPNEYRNAPLWSCARCRRFNSGSHGQCGKCHHWRDALPIRCIWERMIFIVWLDLDKNFEAFLRQLETALERQNIRIHLSSASIEFRTLVDGSPKSLFLIPAPAVSEEDWFDATTWVKYHKRTRGPLIQAIIKEQPGDNAASSMQAHGDVTQEGGLKRLVEPSFDQETKGMPTFVVREQKQDSHGDDDGNTEHIGSSERIQIRCAWAQLVFNIWLEANKPCQAFLSALKAMLDSRNAELDLSTALFEFRSLKLRIDYQTPFGTYILPLARERLEVEWDACLEWLRKNRRAEAPHMSADIIQARSLSENKRERPSHVHGSIEAEGEVAGTTISQAFADDETLSNSRTRTAVELSPQQRSYKSPAVAQRQEHGVDEDTNDGEHVRVMPLGPVSILCTWKSSSFVFLFHLSGTPRIFIAAFGDQIWKLTPPFDLQYTTLKFTSEKGNRDTILSLPLDVSKLQPVWDEVVTWLRDNITAASPHISEEPAHISAVVRKYSRNIQIARPQQPIPFRTYWTMSTSGKKKLVTVTLRTRETPSRILSDNVEHSDDENVAENSPGTTDDDLRDRLTASKQTQPTIVEAKDSPAVYGTLEQNDSRTYALRIYRADSTFATLSATLGTTVQEIVQILGSKTVPRDELDNYCIHMRTQEDLRQLESQEQPLLIQKRLLEQAGHTDYDQFYKIGREDNSHLYRFTFLPTSSLEAFNRQSKEKEWASTPPDSRVKEGVPPSIHRSSEPTSPNVGRDQIEPWQDATQKRAFANLAREHTIEKAANDTTKDESIAREQVRNASSTTDSGDRSHVYSKAVHSEDDSEKVHSFLQDDRPVAGNAATSPSKSKTSPARNVQLDSEKKAAALMDSRPSRANNYWGFCKGAWLTREDAKKGLALRTRPLGLYNTQEVWECTYCTFKGNTFSMPHPSKKLRTITVVDPRIITSGSLIRYKWIFLAKSHVKQKVSDSQESNYCCVFCSLEGRVSSMYSGEETLMYHIAQSHSEGMSEDVKRKARCVFGNQAGDSETEWDINIPGSGVQG